MLNSTCLNLTLVTYSQIEILGIVHKIHAGYNMYMLYSFASIAHTITMKPAVLIRILSVVS